MNEAQIGRRIAELFAERNPGAAAVIDAKVLELLAEGYSEDEIQRELALSFITPELRREYGLAGLEERMERLELGLTDEQFGAAVARHFSTRGSR